jgi:hypothetical protein
MKLLQAYALALVATTAACNAGGVYAERPRGDRLEARGETNGTMFDMVSMTPDGDQWTVRIRGEQMWAAFSLDDRADDFGSVKLEPKEKKKVWKLIDATNIRSRRKGQQDEKNGYVLLRLREPSDDGDAHKVFSVYVSRATEVEAIVELGDYLRNLIKKYHKEKAVF